MFIPKNSNFDSNGLLAVIRNSTSFVAPPIPALARERNGEVEYLLIGQKTWQRIPDGLIGSISLTHVQHFQEGEPLVIVDVVIDAQGSDSEQLLARLTIEAISSATSLRRSGASCSCKEKNGDQTTIGTTSGPNYCAGCTYCGPCQPGYCYRPCVCYGVQDWCYDHVCC